MKIASARTCCVCFSCAVFLAQHNEGLQSLSGIDSSSSAERVMVLIMLLGSDHHVAVGTQRLSLA